MKKDKYKKIYIVLTLICILLGGLLLFFTRGDGFAEYFFHDTLDTGMDFFNSVLYTKGRHPYTQYHTIYPPLANSFFWIIQRCVPRNIVNQWPESYEEGIFIRGTEIDLRLEQILLFAFIIFIVIAAFLFVYVMSYAFEDVRLGSLVGFSFLFSYAGLYAFERGNIILLTVAFSMMFIIFYKSENKWLREFSLVCLAIAAGLKLYPAFFGLLLIVEKRWTESIRAIIYGILLFFVPFLLFDGADGFLAFVNAILDFAGKENTVPLSGYSLESIIRSVLAQILCIFQGDYQVAMWHGAAKLAFVKWVMLLILAVSAICLPEKWKKTLSIGLMIIFTQNATGYILLFLLPAVVMLMQNEEYNKKTMVYFGLLCAICLPIPFFGKWDLLNINYIDGFKQTMILFLLVMLSWDLLMCLWTYLKERKTVFSH